MGHYSDFYDADARERRRVERRSYQAVIKKLKEGMRDLLRIPGEQEGMVAANSIQTAIFWIEHKCPPEE